MHNKLIKFTIAMLLIIFINTPTLVQASEIDEKSQIQTESIITPTTEENETTPIKRTYMLVRRFKRYDPTANTLNLTCRHIGTVSVDNTINAYTPVELIYEHTSSGTFSAQFGTTVTGTIEKNAIVAKASASISFTAGLSVSWTKGTETGVIASIPAKKTGEIKAYIPGVSTRGSLVYSVHDIEHPNSVFSDEYVEVPSIYIPVIDHIHYVTIVR